MAVTASHAGGVFFSGQHVRIVEPTAKTTAADEPGFRRRHSPRGGCIII